jgi:hypothetical protein
VRTTLDIDDDVLLAVKERARGEKRSAGKVLSDVARRGLAGPSSEGGVPTYRNGLRIVPSRGGIVTNELIDRIRDEEGI